MAEGLERTALAAALGIQPEQAHDIRLGETLEACYPQYQAVCQPHHRRRPVVYPLRERRARRGELAQLGRSPFDWFEGRDPDCTLLFLINDATCQGAA